MASEARHRLRSALGSQDVSDWLEKESEQAPLVMGLEAGGSMVVRGDWYKHISVPLQTGTGQARAGRKGGAEGTRRGSPAHTSHAHRPEEVPDLSGDVGARPTAGREEQGAFQGRGRGGPRGAGLPLSPACPPL